MVVVSMLHHAEIGQNDHQENAAHFREVNNGIQSLLINDELRGEIISLNFFQTKT